MFGPKNSLTAGGDESLWGLFPRCVDIVLKMMANAGGKFKLEISCMEFYLFQGYDLMDNRTPIKVGEDGAE
jgi:hypothetical protein